MTCRVQLLPPSNDTPSNRPLGASDRVDMATMFAGFVGLMAMAFSASLPGMALTSKFGGVGLAEPGAADAAGAIIAASRAAAASAGAETVRTRAMRLCICRLQAAGRRTTTQPRYGY